MNYTVGVCGYSGTGSSAVVDLLKEYPDNQVIDSCEFILPYEPDGLLDLEYHLTRGSSKFSSSNTAIYRFKNAIKGGQFRYIRELTNNQLVMLSDDYLSKIVQCKWIGSDPADLCNKPIRDLVRRAVSKLNWGGIFYILEKWKRRELSIFPMGIMYFSAYPKSFYEATQGFVYDVLNAIEPIDSCRNTVLDQPFPGNNPQICFPYFRNPKAIVVDRDPRDLYLLTKEYWFKKQAWRPLPVDTVGQFVTYYRGLRIRQGTDDNSRVLRIQFEDLVYRYTETRSIIEEFLQLSGRQMEKRHFNPEKSLNNTQLFKYYKGYQSEIEYIEKELSEYIYPFERLGKVDFDRSLMFD